ncbi:MAG TPA: ribosome silencing factor [Anaerolineae bacterium]|nr:ribosome silencing factor [Anaerolineae bacterium]
MARIITDLIVDKMGSDVLLLDLSQITLIADYFVIATGDSERQLRAMQEDLVYGLKKDYGINPLSVEGSGSSGWILIDYGSIVVHLFSQAQRSRYRLEDLWGEGRTVVRIA